jgi:hypothetical protein
MGCSALVAVITTSYPIDIVLANAKLNLAIAKF